MRNVGKANAKQDWSNLLSVSGVGKVMAKNLLLKFDIFQGVLLKNGMKTYKPRLLVKSKKYENQRPLGRLAYLQTWHHPDKEKESKMNP